VAVYIDGQNFYNSLKKHEIYFPAFRLEDFLQDIVGSRQQVSAGYYVAKVRQFNDDPQTQKVYTAQRRTLAKVEKAGLKNIIAGNVQYDGTHYREKGVDVRLALDILTGVYEDAFDTAIVVSADTDLRPAYDMAISKGKTLEIVMFTEQVSRALSQPHYNFRVYNTSQLSQYLPKRYRK